jgi:hypothetical protein
MIDSFKINIDSLKKSKKFKNGCYIWSMVV